MFPTTAGKIVSNGPYTNVNEIYKIEGLTGELTRTWPSFRFFRMLDSNLTFYILYKHYPYTQLTISKCFECMISSSLQILQGMPSKNASMAVFLPKLMKQVMPFPIPSCIVLSCRRIFIFILIDDIYILVLTCPSKIAE